MNDVMLYNGDCLELMKNISDNSIDCIICDLPYGTTSLDQLCVEEVLQDLESLSNGADVVLLCYEKADAFCHRHLVSDWLHSYNIDCEELVFGGKNV